MLVVFLSALLMIFFLIARLVYLMIFDAAYYQQKAKTLHEREREIKAARGEIIDRNGKVLATNKAVCTISVIHSQITDPERVIQVLADELGIEKEMIRKRVEKVSSREKIKTNVEKETGDRIRAYELDGVKVDEDFKRYYPYGNLASKVLGFTGGDNQGIIGLEVKYENYLKGVNGMILTTTDARGIELHPGKGGQMVRSAGNSAQLMAKEGKYATLRLPSGEMRMVPIECRASVGVVGNGDHNLVNIGKAGRKRHMGIRPTVRGSVMNPNDHPHGGGEGKTGIGRPGPCTPWGKPALGLKTRKKNKQSNKLIIRRKDGRGIK